MKLNDDCLLHLFEYLHILELVEIRGTCIRLDNLMERLRHKYVNFDFGSVSYRLTSDLARDILTCM